MNIKDLYDTVMLTAPCTHNQFLTHLDTTVNALIGQYGIEKVINAEGGYRKPMTIAEQIPVYSEYTAAVCDNILYLLTGDTDRKTDYAAEAQAAYKTVYARRARGRRILDGGYYHV